MNYSFIFFSIKLLHFGFELTIENVKLADALIHRGKKQVFEMVAVLLRSVFIYCQNL